MGELDRQVLEHLEHEARIDPHTSDLRVEAREDGTVLLEGEVDDIVSKRVAPAVAAGVPGVREVIDRVHVRPAEQMSDTTIAEHLPNALLADTVFDEFNLRMVDAADDVAAATDEAGRGDIDRDLGAHARGEIRIRVTQGVVELSGTVWSLSHRRLAEVLAWWVPGSIDVRNALRVERATRHRQRGGGRCAAGAGKGLAAQLRSNRGTRGGGAHRAGRDGAHGRAEDPGREGCLVRAGGARDRQPDDDPVNAITLGSTRKRVLGRPHIGAGERGL